MKKKTDPWVLGIREALQCVALIRRSNLQTKNRLAVITLDSTLEIAIRQYLTNVKRITLDDKVHRHRDSLLKIAQSNIGTDSEVWNHLKYFWTTRNPQYHQEANVVVTEALYDEFQDIVIHFLKVMYDLDAGLDLKVEPSTMLGQKEPAASIDPKTLKSKVDIIVAIVGSFNVKGPEEIKQGMKKFGIKKKTNDNEIRVYLNSKYFYKDENGFRKLSEVGLQKFSSLTTKKLRGES